MVNGREKAAPSQGLRESLIPLFLAGCEGIYSGDGVGNATDGLMKLPRFANERLGCSETRPRAPEPDDSLSIDAISIVGQM